ncbi:MAG: Tol-Pal system beta propeller repeat protein TolB [bacterium]
MSIYSKLISFLFIFIVSTGLYAQIKVEVKDGAMSEYNIAIAPLIISDDAEPVRSKEITDAIGLVLDITGYFKVLDPRSFLEKADVPPLSTDFKEWLNVGANGLIKGVIKGKESVELELFFFDVAEGKELLRKKYKSSAKAIKKAAHRFASEVIALLSGEEMTFMFSKICFVEKSKETYSLITADFDGSNKKAVYSAKKIILLPGWSADGKKIFFTSYEKSNPNLYSIDVESRQIKLISSHEGLNTSASASPDNKNIALRLSKDGNAEIYVLDTTSGKLTRMTKNMAIDTAPSFSPDGKEIAFVSNRSGNPHIYRLWVNNPERVERLTTQGKYNQDPDYSPDGKYIAFTGRDEFFVFDIFLFDIATRTISRVTQKQGSNETPTFSPDSRLVAFSSNRGGKNALYISNLKGNKQVLVYSGEGEVVTPAWSPEVIKQ